MGNSLTTSNNINNENTKNIEAKRKIDLARQKYMQKILEEDRQQEKLNGNHKERKSPSIGDTDEKEELDPADYEFPFENLVFKGDGEAYLAYCGAIRMLENTGMLQKMKRFGGTSKGAMVAALLATGYNADEIEEVILSPVFTSIYDGNGEKLYIMLSNFLRRFGMYSGDRLYNYIGELFAKKCEGKHDITFNELYERTGKELCIVVLNVSIMKEEYLHVKTTPDMQIRFAIRMAMSTPGYLTAPQLEDNGQIDYYTDGKYVCSYPLHCFDGWWLSMKPKDSFLERLQPLDQIQLLMSKTNRFKYDPEKNKTLGVLQYPDTRTTTFQYGIKKRIGVNPDPYPDTKLSRKRLAEKKLQDKGNKEFERIAMSVDSFLKVLQKNNLDGDNKINRKELGDALKDEEFSMEDRNLLFGEGITLDVAFDAMDDDSSGDINFQELLDFIQGSGIEWQKRYFGYLRREVTNLFSFGAALGNTLMNYVDNAFADENDMDRSVGINTGYVGIRDYDLEPADRDYVVEQGRKTMEMFLVNFAIRNMLEKQQKD